MDHNREGRMKQSEVHKKIRADVRSELNEILESNYYFILGESNQVILLEAGFLDKLSSALKASKEWITQKVKDFVNSEMVQKFTKGMNQIAKNMLQQYKDIVVTFQKINPITNPVKFLKRLIVLIGKNPEKYKAEDIIIPKENQQDQDGKIKVSNAMAQAGVQSAMANQAESKVYDKNLLFEFYDAMGYNLDNFFQSKDGELIEESIEEGLDSIISLSTHGFTALTKILHHLATKANNNEFAQKIKDFEKKYNPEHVIKNAQELAGDKGEQFVNDTLEEAQIPRILNHTKKENFTKIMEAIIFIGLFAISISAILHAGPALFVVEATAMAITAPATFKDLIKIFESFELTKELGTALRKIEDTFLKFLGKVRKEDGDTAQPQTV